MIKHVIIWKLKDEFSGEKKETIKREMKENLEVLVGKVPGLLEVTVTIDLLETSTGDVMLDTTLESAEALKGYAVHPDHVHVADTYVRPFTEVRMCVDYKI